MRLISATVGPFKSIDVPQTVDLDPAVTVLVGMNEAGKTVFLKALEKSSDALGVEKFEPVEDYPRKDLTKYQKRHATAPEVAVKLTYQLSPEDVAEANAKVGTNLPAGYTFSFSHKYDNKITVAFSINESAAITRLAQTAKLSSDARATIAASTSIRAAAQALKTATLTDDDKAVVVQLDARVAKAPAGWASVIEYEFWSHISPRIPKFAYFGEYEMLPSKVNLAALQGRVANPTQLSAEDRSVLALLRMADISLEELATASAYEPMQAKLEGVSISLTDQIMTFWKANESSLEVQVDIKSDATEIAPYNNGANLYLRIRNLRHRGVSTPFRHRSRGFVWFFSFLVWFDSVQEQLGLHDKAASPAILLLDEPGLNLHALAQRDFLKYIDTLAEGHQVIYTTHSPFMVHADRLKQVRVVEDKDGTGTTISPNVGSSSDRTLFPLQAALGYTVAQNLFISERNLVVEGPSELLYLTTVSTLLEGAGVEALREDVTIVPAGGLDKVVTFVALLNASGLKLAVLHDYNGTPDQKLMDLVRQKLISKKAVLNASQFRDLSKVGENTQPSDIEDLLPVALYVDYFNQAFAKQLGGAVAAEGDLPPRPRVIQQLEAWLEAKQIQLRPSGGFNHYAVAAAFAAKPPKKLSADTRDRFVALFTAINSLY
jgi:predicted ATP-dependent endonuclease of OLD family